MHAEVFGFHPKKAFEDKKKRHRCARQSRAKCNLFWYFFAIITSDSALSSSSRFLPIYNKVYAFWIKRDTTSRNTFLSRFAVIFASTRIDKYILGSGIDQ